jgi:hypothetical protein
MSAIFLMIHSITRWLVVLVGVIAIVKFLIGWLGKNSFQKMDNGLAAGFGGLMDLQATLGLILLLWNGLVDGAGFPRYRLEHMGVMIVAVVLTHLSARWKKSEDGVRFRNTALLFLGVLVLIFAGIATLPNGLTR